MRIVVRGIKRNFSKYVAHTKPGVMEVSEEIMETNAANWSKKVTESKELVVVEFWHPECSYCKMLEPLILSCPRNTLASWSF